LLAVGTSALAASLPKQERQVLAIVVHRDNVATQRLAHYDTTGPIRVRVGGDTLKFQTLSITARGPGGIAMQAPLTRFADGFAGNVRLATPGTWTVALTTNLGYATSAIATIPVDVVTYDGSAVAGLGVMTLAMASIALGLLIVLRRDIRSRVVAVTVRYRR